MENTRIFYFLSTRKIISLYLQFCTSLSIALKLVLRKKWCKR